MTPENMNDEELHRLDLTDSYGGEFEPYEKIGWKDHFLLYAIAASFLAFVIWANISEVDEVTRGEGKVIPFSEVKQIQNLEGGIIEELMVNEGDIVNKNEVILKIRSVEASSNYEASYKRYLGLKASIARLRAESEGAVLSFDQEVIEFAPDAMKTETESFEANKRASEQQRKIIEEQLSQKKQEVKELNNKISDLKKVLSYSHEELLMVKNAAKKGATSPMEVLQLERGVVKQEGELKDYELSVPRIKSSVKEFEGRLKEHDAKIEADASRQMAERMAEMNTIKESLAALKDRQERTEIRSPVRGKVKDIMLTTIGGVVKPGETIMEIVPEGDLLIIEANIRPSDIAFLHPEQKVTVKVTAYDYSIYGGLKGNVTDISPDTIENDKGESFYRVYVTTDKTSIYYNGKDHDIIPGMTVSVDILTGKKTIMSYILKPFKKAMNSALRER